ncbi:unnamed protein product [Caenorhabditis bovis]|uniref:C-type lectin domain-containing protein n=1 Tax=Caenorhabditis bovis TaxID=2654633 RepID=A0A8S1F4Q4_9PELO|nr:unnamed protein product [Caenorhabditis bovis]
MFVFSGEYNNHIFLLLVATSFAFAAENDDEQFNTLCTELEGLYTPSKGNEPDTCSNVKLKYDVIDDEMAKKVCQRVFPYTVLSAKKLKEFTITCNIGIELRCGEGWTQIYDKCYNFQRRVRDYNNTMDTCKINAGRVAVLDNMKLIQLFDNAFGPMSHVWIDSRLPERYAQIKTGEYAQIAYDLAPMLSVEYQSLILVKGTEMAQVICEYRPSDTVPYLKKKISRLSEIYYSGDIVENRLIIRTGSSYVSNEKGFARAFEHTICNNMLNAIGVRGVRGALEFKTEDQLRKILLDSDLKNQGALYHSPVIYSNVLKGEACFPMQLESKIITDCSGNVFQPAQHGAYEYERYYYKGTHTNASQLLAQTNGARGPMICQSVFVSVTYNNCQKPEDHFAGRHICHRPISWATTYDNAQEACRRMGMVLAGVNSNEERDWIYERVKKENGDQDYWFGARRKLSCLYHSCDWNEMYSWENGIASDRTMETMSFFGYGYPKYRPQTPHCLVMKKHSYYKGAFGEDDCQNVNRFVCSNLLKVVKSDYE